MGKAALMKNLLWFLDRMTEEQLERMLWYAKKIL